MLRVVLATIGILGIFGHRHRDCRCGCYSNLTSPVVVEDTTQVPKPVPMPATPPRRIDQNDLARRITLCEGGKKSQSIAQVKETLRCTLETLAKMLDDGEATESEVMELVSAKRCPK